MPRTKSTGARTAEHGTGIADGYASNVSPKRLARSSRPQARFLLTVVRLRTAVSEVDTVGHRRFSGALNAPGARNGSLPSRPVALILMGDWRVPAGHDSQNNEDRGAYQSNDRRDRRYQAFGPRREESLREFFRLTGRGLMGDPIPRRRNCRATPGDGGVPIYGGMPEDLQYQ